MKTIVISGGNSGIGLEAGRQLARKGHRVVLLGRDPAKGAAAVEAIRREGRVAEFLPSDLSTHAGVRSAADQLARAYPVIDGLVLGAGTLTLEDTRTADGLHVVFATNYLSRYHLAQRLLPQVLASATPTVLFIVAGVSLNSEIDFGLFPKYSPFPGMSALSSIQIANYRYAAHLAREEPKLRVAVLNVGLVKTEIMRDMPPFMRFMFKAMGPLITISVEKAASNATHLLTTEGWSSGIYLPKPGRPNNSQPLGFQDDVTGRVMKVSRELTGA